MRKEVERLSEHEILKTHPISGRAHGWYFRVLEISNGAWVVEGVDLWGRKLSAQGEDPAKLLKELALEADLVNERIGNT